MSKKEHQTQLVKGHSPAEFSSYKPTFGFQVMKPLIEMCSIRVEATLQGCGPPGNKSDIAVISLKFGLFNNVQFCRETVY